MKYKKNGRPLNKKITGRIQVISYTSIDTREQLSGFLLAFLHSDSIELGYNVQSSLENKKF